MRKLLLAGLAVSLLTAIAYAQAERGDALRSQRLLDEANQVNEAVASLPMTCVDADGVARKIDETAKIANAEFKCVMTYGDRMKPKGAGWVSVGPGSHVKVSVF